VPSGPRTRSFITPLQGGLPRQWWLAAAIVIGIANTGLLAIAVAVNASYVDTFGQVSTAVAEGVAAIASAVVARRMVGHARLAWAFFAAALAVWSLTDWAYLVAMLTNVEVPEVSAFDIGWLFFYVPMLSGLFLAYRRLRPERGWQGLLDGTLLALTGGLFCWMFLLEPLAQDASGGFTGTLVNLLYPSFDLLIVATVLWIVLRLRKVAPAWLWLMTAALAAQMLGDLTYLVASAHNADATASFSPVAFTAGGWLWTCAAICRAGEARRAWFAPQQSSPPVWSRAIPFVLGCAMFGPLIPADPAVGLVAMAGAALAIARVVHTLAVNERLLQERNSLLGVDPLTGAHSRRYFTTELQETMRRCERSRDPVSLIVFDLDRFKPVNDTYGHAMGDELLCAIVARARGALRSGDVICRLGGDEFAVIAPQASVEGAKLIASRLREAVRRAGEELIPGCGVTASLGIATAPDHGSDPDQLVRHADEALYAAKHAGRNTIRIGSAHEPVPAPA
jgi:diguanylate cyclase (GGDEF)-like protein